MHSIPPLRHSNRAMRRLWLLCLGVICGLIVACIAAIFARHLHFAVVLGLAGLVLALVLGLAGLVLALVCAFIRRQREASRVATPSDGRKPLNKYMLSNKRKRSDKRKPSDKRLEEAEQTIAQLVETFCASVELKDPYTRGHSERVTAYLLFLADKLQPFLPGAERRRLRYAGLLHDIGKIHIPETILKKPTKLSPEEMSAIRQHPRIGAELISHIPSLAGTIPIILHHHERYDGTGYPARLKGTEIPLEARIACLADTFDAMTSNRAYRQARTLDQALEEIIANSGSQFDPAIVNVLIREYDGLRALYWRLHDPSSQPGA